MAVRFQELIEEIRGHLPHEESRLLSSIPAAEAPTTIIALERLLSLALGPQPTAELGIREALSGNNRRAALAAILLFRVYTNPLESTRQRTVEGHISNECGAYLFSMFRELQGWEPASALDLALVVKTDRAVIRSARVAAAHVDPEAFMNWLSSTHTTLERGQAHWLELSQWLETMPGGEPDPNILQQREREFHRIARRCLRDYGIMHGRAGLQNLRNELGAARIPARTAEQEAKFSEDVVILAGHFIKLTVAERNAFRVLTNRLESALESAESKTISPLTRR